MMMLLLLAAAAPNPNGAPYGVALSMCASRNLVKYDDGKAPPSVIAHKAVGSCTSELSTMRAAMRQIVSHNISPDTPAAKQAISAHMANITGRFEQGVAAEVQRRRGNLH